MMAKPSGLFLLLSIYTALLATSCGIEYKIGLFVVAAASVTTTAAAVGVNARGASATCGAGSDQPGCDDPSYDYNNGGKAAARQMKAAQQLSRGAGSNTADRHRAATNTSKDKDKAFCAFNDCGSRSGGGGGIRLKFHSGDIIELYNTDSRDIQIVFPSIVKGRDPTSPQHYRVTKTTDGKEVTNLPEKFLHMYVPYSVGDEALCNIGEFKKARPIIVRCTVLSYEQAASRGAMVLQGNYEVQVHATKANEEYTTTLPVWKLQRRYLATANTATG